MINFSEEVLVQELYHNFLDSLTVVSSRLVFSLLDKKEPEESFDKSEFLDSLVSTWKDGTQQILQFKINEFYEFSKTLKNQRVLNVLYGDIDIEDIQTKCNEAYKAACVRVDTIVRALKDE